MPEPSHCLHLSRVDLPSIPAPAFATGCGSGACSVHPLPQQKAQRNLVSSFTLVIVHRAGEAAVHRPPREVFRTLGEGSKEEKCEASSYGVRT